MDQSDLVYAAFYNVLVNRPEVRASMYQTMRQALYHGDGPTNEAEATALGLLRVQGAAFIQSLVSSYPPLPDPKTVPKPAPYNPARHQYRNGHAIR